MLELTEGLRLSERFTLVRLLGQGGMGAVWLAQDHELHDRVALKIIHPHWAASQAMAQWLRNECRNTRRLAHPNIVRVFDFHTVEPHRFISMEYVQGSDLRQLIAREYTAFVPRIVEITAALEYAHGLAIVHRDLKASNILCDRSGTARLVDFGIAAARADQDALPLRSGGSLYSMSPQQLAHEQPQPADDIYALGALLYELVTGHPPFYPHITAEKIMSVPPPPMQGRYPVPPELDALVTRLLAKTPGERPSSMSEIRRALQTLGSAELTVATPIATETVAQPGPPIKPISIEVSSGTNTQTKRTVPASLAWIALGVIALAAAGLFYYLPKIARYEVQGVIADRPAQQRPQASPAPAPLPQREPSPWQQAQLAREREKAQTVLQTLLEKQAVLESKSVTQWEGQAFENVRAKAAEGDALFHNGDFKAAAASYSEGIAALERLGKRAEQALETALAAGWQAFQALDSEAAIEQFRLALTIDATNESAKKGLGRSERLSQVMALLASGEQHEKGNDLALARIDYQQANELDPEFEPARTALDRVNAQIDEARFNEAMSAGFTALERKDFLAARKAFHTAGKLKPRSQEPADGLAQVALNVRLAQMASHRKKAEALASQEHWKEAAQHYGAALGLDPTLVFAKQGKARSLERAALSDKLDLYINEPQRLSSDEVLEAAAASRNEALAVQRKGPRLRQQIARLTALIETAKTPVRVRLESDNETDVVVYKVGRLGTFGSHELELRPGTYTVVGTRSGYRDVRRQFTIVAGRTPPAVIIRCEERI